MAGAGHRSAITDRERQVLALVARHLTNAEIAAELVLSVRTVESHVSALIRKLDVTDRRGVARAAPAVLAAQPRRGAWPAPVSGFVGRDAERDDLAAAVSEHRMVTVIGPGGAGKTRLAIEVAGPIAAAHSDGAWFVDLVQVSDPDMVVAAMASALGVPEQQGRSLADGVVAELRPADALLVVDNCEHLLDAVRTIVVRLLTSCPALSVLATSRTSLGTPEEWVYRIGGLAVGSDGGDAATLFLQRAAAATSGHPPARAEVTDVCELLDGLPLAIELAAARYPSLGLDGIRAGLDEGLRPLTSAANGTDRHGSMHGAIAWSYDLLDPADRAVLCAVAVFASWFDVTAAASVAGIAAHGKVADALGRLTEHSLLVAAPGSPTRYRALEVIRQFGEQQLDLSGTSEHVHDRHRRWCATALSLLAAMEHDEAWCEQFDPVAADARAAIVWASRHAVGSVPGLAEQLAAQLLLRGQPAESQTRYEQAATCSPAGEDRARLLRLAAGVAAARMVGNDTLRLFRAAADDALARGDRAAAAQDLAWMSIYTNQAPGIMAAVPTEADDARTLLEAQAQARGSSTGHAAVATAAACRVTPGRSDVGREVERAVELAHESALPLLESAALDQMSTHCLARHDYGGALAALRRRGDVLDRVALSAASAFQVNDYLLMASEVHLAVGDLGGAARFADRLATFPCYRQQDHLALGRRIKVEALAGDLEAAADDGERFRWSWQRAGRPVASNLGPTTYAVAMVHGLLGDEERRRQWLDITTALVAHRPTQRPEGCLSGWAPTLDALVSLDQGRPDLALERLAADIDDDEVWARWNAALWLPWYAALWAEAAVLGHHPDAAARLRRSRSAVQANPIATGVVDRAADLAVGDRAGLDRHARTFAALHCSYQERRTRVLQDQAV